RALEERNRAAFEHARAHAREHVLLRTALENDVVDAGALQELAQQQSRGPGADDGNLSAHRAILQMEGPHRIRGQSPISFLRTRQRDRALTPNSKMERPRARRGHSARL